MLISHFQSLRENAYEEGRGQEVGTESENWSAGSTAGRGYGWPQEQGWPIRKRKRKRKLKKIIKKSGRMPKCITPKQAPWSLLKIDYFTYVIVEEYAGVMFKWVRTCLRIQAMSTQFFRRFSQFKAPPVQQAKSSNWKEKKRRRWIINVLFDFTDSLGGFTFLDTYLCAIHLLYLLQWCNFTWALFCNSVNCTKYALILNELIHVSNGRIIMTEILSIAAVLKYIFMPKSVISNFRFFDFNFFSFTSSACTVFV